MFEQILGNEPIKAFLRKAVADERLPQTLLFAGPDGVGKSLFAKALAAHLLKNDRSPDFHLVAPEGKSGLYAIDTLREMIDQEHAAPFEAPGKVFLLEDAERMQPAQANALLKTLEEPRPDTTFILLSNAPNAMLPTFLSRCTVLFFQPLTEEAIASLLQANGLSTRFAKLSSGSAGRAFELSKHPEIEEQRKVLFDILAKNLSYPELSLQLEKLEKLIEEGKDEDPVRVNRRVEHLFTYILMWHRDQHLRQLGERQELLFFPEEPARLPVPFKKIEKAVAQARLAYQRNIQLTAIFRTILT